MRRLMFIEEKGGNLSGEGRMGWVDMSRSCRTYRYAGRELLRIGGGYKYNALDVESGTEFWVSGPHRDGADMLYGGVVAIDEDARVEYWTTVRNCPDRVSECEYRAGASTRTGTRTRQVRARA
jgi:hypothetical protein